MPTDARPRRLLMPEDLRRPFRYATRRNPNLRTRGGKIAVLAGAMGRPLLPHQQYIADVATELNPPGSRLLFRYQLVIINEPRQVGKTTIIRPIFTERCLTRPGTKAFMTAQLGKYASARWEDLVADIESSRLLGSFVKVNRGKGDQRCTFPNTSFIAPFAPEPDAIHGETTPLVGIDEGWAFSGEQGGALVRAIRPAQVTRPDRQLYAFSAAGTADSEWWNELVELGRASVDDPNSTIAYFEHSADPDADPYDPATWEFHPGLDGLITIEDLAAEAESNTHADFLRGFLNISTRTRDHTVIDLDVFDGLAGQQETPDAARVAYGYDVAIDRTAAAVWTAWRDDAGKMNLHVLETREGADWLPEYIGRVYEDTSVPPAADDGGPARLVTDRLKRAGVPVEVVAGRDSSTAWGGFKAMVRDGELIHDGSRALRGAIEVAAERPVNDAHALSRRHSLGPIDPLMAAVVASWRADRLTGIQIF